MTFKVQSLKIWMNLKKLMSSRFPPNSHRYTQIMLSAESIADSDPKMDNYVRCWLHRCFYGGEQETLILFENPERQGNLMQSMVVRKREASAQRTPADHPRRESLMSCRETWCIFFFIRQWTNSKHVLSKTEATNSETSSRVVFILFLDLLTHQMLEDLLLNAIKITCSVRQDLNSWSRNTKCNLWTTVLMSFSNELMLKDWNCVAHNTDIINLEETELVYKKNYLWRNRFSDILKLKSETCTKWEKWRELKYYELTKVSEQKLRESHETKERLTSQLQDVQEQTNSLNDSGEFKDVESNHSGRFITIPVNLQRFQVLVPCWAATNACCLTHGIHLDHRSTFWKSIFYVWFTPQSSSRNSLLYDTKRTRISYASNRDRDSVHKRLRAK